MRDPVQPHWHKPPGPRWSDRVEPDDLPLDTDSGILQAKRFKQPGLMIETGFDGECSLKLFHARSS